MASVCLHTALFLLAGASWARAVPLVVIGSYRHHGGSIEADLIEGEEEVTTPQNQASAVDNVAGMQDRAQGASAADPSGTATATTAPPASPPATILPLPNDRAPRSSKASTPAPPATSDPDDPEGPDPKSAASSRASQSAARAASSGSAADPRSSAAVLPAGPRPEDLPAGQGGGSRRSSDPDVAERFTHDLPSFAAPVAAWSTSALGDAGELELLLVIDAEGHISARGREALERAKTEPKASPAGKPSASRLPRGSPSAPKARAASGASSPKGSAPTRAQPRGRPSDALVDSIRRVVDGLYSGFALPGALAGPGYVRVRVTAHVSQLAEGAERPKDRVQVGSTPLEAGQGHAYFTLESGRRVDFDIAILEVVPEP